MSKMFSLRPSFIWAAIVLSFATSSRVSRWIIASQESLFRKKSALQLEPNLHHGEIWVDRSHLPVSGPPSDLPAAGVSVRQAGMSRHNTSSHNFQVHPTYSGANIMVFCVLASRIGTYIIMLIVGGVLIGIIPVKSIWVVCLQPKKLHLAT